MEGEVGPEDEVVVLSTAPDHTYFISKFIFLKFLNFALFFRQSDSLETIVVVVGRRHSNQKRR